MESFDGQNMQWSEIPEHIKNQIIYSFIEAKKFNKYIILMLQDINGKYHGGLVLEDNFILSQSKQKPVSPDISALKNAMKVMFVDWVKKYKSVVVGSHNLNKIKTYKKYADYFIKKYNHAKIKNPKNNINYFIMKSLD